VSEELDQYLAQTYRRDVMGESVTPQLPAPSDDLFKEIDAEVARIDALRLGAHLASRDFASYQSRRALMRLRLVLRQQKDRSDAATTIKQPGGVQEQRADADGGSGEVTPRPEPEASPSDSV
jgi:hypothetical protein